MEHVSWNNLLPSLLDSVGDEVISPKGNARIGIDSYIIPSHDRKELIFAVPFMISRDIIQEIGLPVQSSAGAIHEIIERIKKESPHNPGLSPLHCGKKPENSRYTSFCEPCTIASSPSRIASHLWRPDDQNRAIPGGLELLLRGSLPYMSPDVSYIPYLQEILNRYADAVRGVVMHIPSGVLEHAWRAVWDQQDLRSQLNTLDLVCFIGDNTRPARTMTRERCWYRVAGPKQGVHIPFICPKELEPVEVTLTGSQETISGLGIKKKEVFAITGANAEGKTSLLEAILSGEDDHAIGDGREHLVTAPGIVKVDATNLDIRGADVSQVFCLTSSGDEWNTLCSNREGKRFTFHGLPDPGGDSKRTVDDCD